MYGNPVRISILLGITRTSLNNVKVRCVGKDEYVYDSYVRNNDTAKLKYIQKATKSFAYDEDTKACKKRLDKLAKSTADFYGENHLHYFTHENPNNCVVCHAAEGIL